MYRQTKTLWTLEVGVLMEMKFPVYGGTYQFSFKTEISGPYSQLSKQMEKQKRKQRKSKLFWLLTSSYLKQTSLTPCLKNTTCGSSFILCHGYRDSSTTKVKGPLTTEEIINQQEFCTKRQQQRYKNDGKFKSDVEQLHLKEKNRMYLRVSTNVKEEYRIIIMFV